jgi:hypothetical protein
MRSLTVRMRALGRSPMRDMWARLVELEVSDIALTLPQRSVTVMVIRPAAHLLQPT